MNSLFQRIRNGDPLFTLILVNGLIFLGIEVYRLWFWFSDLALPLPWGEDLMLAANSDVTVMSSRPWSLITHMFTHVHTGHFLFNMVALYSMGKLFASIEKPSRLWLVYLLGGLAGYGLFVISYAVSPVLNGGMEHSILGASAAVMAIVIATATLQPRRIGIRAMGGQIGRRHGCSEQHGPRFQQHSGAEQAQRRLQSGINQAIPARVYAGDHADLHQLRELHHRWKANFQMKRHPKQAALTGRHSESGWVLMIWSRSRGSRPVTVT
jgi:membrane associated rhomboid family serine protease